MSTVPPAPGPPGPPFTQWARLGLQPATALYVQRDDQLYVRAIGSQSAEVDIAVRLQSPEDGKVVPSLFTFINPGDRTSRITLFGLAEGFLLGLVVFAPSTSYDSGAIFVEVGLSRGGAGVQSRVQVLVSGYLTTNAALGWPHVTQQPAHEPAGRVQVITGADPAAGVEASSTVPLGAHWMLYSWRASLVTDATVATRRVHLVIDDGATILLDSACTDTQAASLTRNYNAALWGFAPTAVVPELYLSLPNLVHLEAGFRVRTITENLQAGDNWGAPLLQVLESLS